MCFAGLILGLRSVSSCIVVVASNLGAQSAEGESPVISSFNASCDLVTDIHFRMKSKHDGCWVHLSAKAVVALQHAYAHKPCYKSEHLAAFLPFSFNEGAVRRKNKLFFFECNKQWHIRCAAALSFKESIEFILSSQMQSSIPQDLSFRGAISNFSSWTSEGFHTRSAADIGKILP